MLSILGCRCHTHRQRKISWWSEEVWWQKKGKKNVYGVGACVIVCQAEQGWGHGGSREQYDYVVRIVNMARMLQGIPWNWGWHLCCDVGLWYGRKIEVIEMLLEDRDWAEGRGWMGMGMQGRDGCHSSTRLKGEQGLHARRVFWGGGGRGLCRVGSGESCSRPARYQASLLPPRHRSSRIAWVRHDL